jgi:hypothetical protein
MKYSACVVVVNSAVVRLAPGINCPYAIYFTLKPRRAKILKLLLLNQPKLNYLFVLFREVGDKLVSMHTYKPTYL